MAIMCVSVHRSQRFFLFPNPWERLWHFLTSDLYNGARANKPICHAALSVPPLTYNAFRIIAQQT